MTLVVPDHKLVIAEAFPRSPFREGASTGQKREAVLIEAGWGSSGYYSEEVLARDIPRIFPAGTHMYLNHPSESENRDRPERNVLDLVGVIAETPRMAGIAAVSVIQIFEHWVKVIDELADHIGLSIRAYGTSKEGDAGGKHGQIITALTEGISVDYVTKAGAGGSIGQMVESVRERVIPLIESARENTPPVNEVSNMEIRRALDDAGTERWGNDNTYVYLEDFDEEAGTAIYCVSPRSEERSYWKVSYTRNNLDVTLSDSAEEVERKVVYVPSSDEESTNELSEEPTEEAQANEVVEAPEFYNFINRVAKQLSYPVPFKDGSGRKPQKESEDMSDKDRLSELEESVRRLKEELKTTNEKLTAATDRADRAEDALRLREAGSIVNKVVNEAEGLPKTAKARAIEAALRGELPTDSSGNLDKSALEERARGKVTEEREYLAGVGGEVRGFGESASTGVNGNGGSSTEEVSALQEAFERRGMSKEAAKAAAEGR